MVGQRTQPERYRSRREQFELASAFLASGEKISEWAPRNGVSRQHLHDLVSRVQSGELTCPGHEDRGATAEAVSVQPIQSYHGQQVQA